ncbi:hypothetical protein [Aquimarina sediminis]|uniref:hypothetical protein n=1 Tax=Aquimarina sediminis TaxID=2070536 RepID=UPI000CA008A1|nr:hypothetical protein [Aquimarina sediminis]
MNVKIWIVVFLLPFTMFSQQKLLSPMKEATLILRNNTILNGFARIMSNYKIIFKKDKNSKKEKYDAKQVKQLIVFEEEGESKFEYKKSGKKGKYLLLNIIVEGKCLFIS